MFTMSKKEFSEELRVVEKIPNIPELQQSSTIDYYMIAESNPNIYENIDSMNPDRRTKFELKFDDKIKDNLVNVNTDYIKNKLSKKSIITQNWEKLIKKINKIKKVFYEIFESPKEENLFSIDNFSIEVNSSLELLSILINHKILIIYNTLTFGK